MDCGFRRSDDGGLGGCGEWTTDRVGVALTQILLCKMLRIMRLHVYDMTAAHKRRGAVAPSFGSGGWL